MKAAATVAVVALAALASGASAVVEDSLKCEACEYATSAVGSFLAQNSTETKVISFIVESVCPALGKESSACAVFAPTLIPKLFESVEAELPQVCTVAGFCTSDALENFKLAKAPVKGALGCKLCEFVATELEQELADNTTQAKIIAGAEALCDKLGAEAATCKEYVDAYGAALLQLLSQAVDPESACEAIKLCAPSGANDAKTCALCEFGLNEVKSALSDNATVAKIVTQLETYCSDLSGDLAAECTQLVDSYAAIGMAYIASQIDAETDCTKIGVCPGSSAPKAVVRQGASPLILGKAAAAALDRRSVTAVAH